MPMAWPPLALSALSSLFWACQNQIPSKTRMQCIYTSVMRRHCFVRHTSNPAWESVNKSTGHFRTMSFHHIFKKCGSLAAKQLNDWNLSNMFNNKLHKLTQPIPTPKRSYTNSMFPIHVFHGRNLSHPSHPSHPSGIEAKPSYITRLQNLQGTVRPYPTWG